MILVATKNKYYGGPLLVFEASEDELVDLGYVSDFELPKIHPRSRYRSVTGNDFKSTYRLPCGSIRLVISAHLVRNKDHSLNAFLSKFEALATISAVSYF